MLVRRLSSAALNLQNIAEPNGHSTSQKLAGARPQLRQGLDKFHTFTHVADVAPLKTNWEPQPYDPRSLAPRDTDAMSTEIFSPVTLPCSGRTMANKLVKVALYEHLAKVYGGPPNKYHLGLYTEWAKHDWGMVMTGNVQVSREHLTLGRDIIIPEVLNEDTLAPFKALARTIHGEDSHEPSSRPLAVMQLSHAGRQSPNFMGGRKLGVAPLAPSPVRLGSNKKVRSQDGVTTLDAKDTPHPYIRALFQVPRQMTLRDIKEVQQAFVRGAVTALEAGLDGIQLHCAHGYLLAQFLNPKSNIRTDEYSLGSEEPLRMVREIVDGIRAAVPKDFVIGIKINSADYVESGENSSDERVLKETRRVVDHIRAIAHWGMVDFIEISGGDYESPDFMATKKGSPRQAFFAQFAKKARESITSEVPMGVKIPLVLLTGGLRSPAHLQSALDAGHADLLGIGRGSVLRPNLPEVLWERIARATTSNTSIASDDEPFAPEPDGDLRLPSWIPQMPLLGAGVGLAWYNVRIRRIAESQLDKTADGNMPPPPLTFGMTGLEAMTWMWVWMDLWVWMDWNGVLVGGGLFAGVACCAAGLAFVVWCNSSP